MGQPQRSPLIVPMLMLPPLFLLIPPLNSYANADAGAEAPITNTSVTYDPRSLIINGQRKLVISAAIHYPRSVPAVSSCTLSLSLSPLTQPD